MKIYESNKVGTYEIIKEARLIGKIARETGYSEAYIRQMFLGIREMSEKVWTTASIMADDYLNKQIEANKKAENLAKKYKSIKSNRG